MRACLLLTAVTFLGCGTDMNESIDPPVSVPEGSVLVPTECTPPALLLLGDIPDNPSLDNDDSDTLAIFEVDGHNLIGKFVRDDSAAEGGLRLWQEMTLRIPENQLRDLVQLNIYQNSSTAANFNRRGDVNTERFGLRMGFNVSNFSRNDRDPCAPLDPRRGTFEWSLIHEFGHLRGWLDGSWGRFLDTFPDESGDGDGYPEDDSPLLTGDFVTSYAERADGDEDHAETFTTFVMLGDDAIPAEAEGEPLVISKLRWIANQPGMAELRRAIRITEPNGGGVVVGPAPAIDPTKQRP